jgi:hypothetical protein
VRASTIFLIALLLACPLMMLFMHRGHGGKGSEHPERGAHGAEEEQASLDDLRSRRDDLDAEIARREEVETGETAPRR